MQSDGGAARCAWWASLALIPASIAYFASDHCDPAPWFGAAALAASWMLMLFARRRGGAGALAATAGAAVSTIALFGAAWLADEVLRLAEARAVAAPIFNYPAAAFLRLCGYDPAISGGLLHIDQLDGLVSIAPTMEKTGARPAVEFLLVLWLGTAAAGVGAWWNRALAATGAFAASAFARYSLLTLAYISRDSILARRYPPHLEIYWNQHGILAWLLLTAAALAASRRLFAPHAFGGAPARGRFSPAFAAGGFAFAASIATLAYDPGERKAGRVLIDDIHSSHWEPSARMLDESWYGDFATYSFTSAAEWLGRRYAVDVVPSGKLTAERLAGYDVLILKTPIVDYDLAELRAIHDFVERGGGLLAVGDHTNLMGLGTRLNQVLEPYPMKFRYDSIFTSSNGAFSNYQGSAVWRHPAALHVDTLQFMTSCSLRLQEGAEPVLIVGDSGRELANYSNSSHFGNPVDDPALDRGPMILGAACRAGAGRIVAFTDSTIWSSFDLFKNGHERLLLDSVEYLNRSNAGSGAAARAMAVAAAVGAALLCLASSRALGRLSLGAVAAIVAGCGAGAAAANRMNAAAYAWPEERERPPEAVFQWEGGECALPPVLGVDCPKPEVVFDTLFVTMQRLGIRPRVAWRLDDVLDPAPDAVVVVNPLVRPSPGYAASVAEYVHRGGSLILMAPFAHAATTTVGAYLKPMGLACELHVAKDEPPHVHATGFEQIEIAAPGDSAWVARHGKGRVYLLADSEHYSRSGIGHAFSIPWTEAKARYEAIYKIFGDVAALRPKDRRFYGIVP